MPRSFADPPSSTAPQVWRALIQAEESAPYLSFLDAVEDHLLSRSWTSAGESPARTGEGSDGRSPVIQAMADDLGRALYLGYLERSFNDRCAPGAYERHADAAISSISENVIPALPIGGFVQVAWTVEHLQRLFRESDPDPDEEDPMQEIDAFLVDFLAQSPWPWNYDLIGGLAGYAAYGMDRLPRASGRAIVELVVKRLEELAEPVGDGLTWFTPPKFLPPWQREMYPRGYYNLGVAHGVPGVISILAGAVACGIESDRAGALLDGAVRWFLSQRLSAGSVAQFNTNLLPDDDRPHPVARLAWCYGDAGIAITLLDSARKAGLSELESVAMEIAIASARRDPETAGVVDGSLCHGSCGLGHLFNRLWQATGESPFAEAARFWFRDGLRRFEAEPDLSGLVKAGEPRLEKDLIIGSAGMGLTLLAALTDRIPAWDSQLLMDIAPRSTS